MDNETASPGPADEGTSRPFRELLPEGWRSGEDLWVRAYRAVGVPLEHVRPPLAVDLRDGLVLVFWGSMPRMSLDVDFEPHEEGEIRIGVRTQSGTHPTGPTLLIITRIDGPWNSETIDRCRNHVQELAGLLALHSMSLVAHRLEDYVVRLPEGRIEPTAVKVAGPGMGRRPLLSKELSEAFEAIGRVLAEHPSRRRIGLSLRWMDEALRTEGEDAVVKAWVALETLAMPDTRDIGPMNEILGDLYGLSKSEANQRFLTGRLYGLRSRIVHGGEVVSRDSPVPLYMHALYKDLFFAELHGEPARLAQAYLDEQGEKVRLALGLTA